MLLTSHIVSNLVKRQSLVQISCQRSAGNVRRRSIDVVDDFCIFGTSPPDYLQHFLTSEVLRIVSCSDTTSVSFCRFLFFDNIVTPGETTSDTD